MLKHKQLSGLNNIPLPFLLIVSLLIISPIVFASNRAVFWLVDIIFIGVITITFFWNLIVQKKQLPVMYLHYRVAITCFLIVLAWTCIQLLPLPWPSSVNPYWNIASNTLGLEKSTFISIASDQFSAFDNLIRWIGYGMVFLLTLQYARSSSHSSLLIKVILGTCLACAVYGIIIFVSGNDTILWMKKYYYKEDLTGTFINRNNFATYMGIGLLISAHYFMDSFLRNTKGAHGRALGRVLIHNFFSSSRFYFVFLIIFFAALLLTHSRAGMTCTLLAFIVQLSFHIKTLKKKANLSVLLIPVAIVIIFCLFFFGIGGGQLMERFNTITSDNRVDIYHITLEAIRNNLWFGTGLGSFEQIFSIYRDASLWPGIAGKMGHAHNTYLESLLELGLPAFLLLVIAIAYLCLLCVKGVLARKQNSRFSCIAVSVSILIWLHALVDFSIEMPAMAITYAAILAIGVAQSWSSRKQLSADGAAQNVQICKSYYLLVFIGIGLLASAIVTLPNAMIGYRFEFLNHNIKYKKEKPYKALESFVARDNDWFPKSGDTKAKLAYANILLAYDANIDATKKQFHLLTAQRFLSDALSSRPLHGVDWLRLAYIASQFPHLTNGLNTTELLYNALLMRPYDKRHILNMIGLLPTVWGAYTSSQQAYFLGQIRYLWDVNIQNYQRKEIILTMNNPIGIKILRSALADSSQETEELNTLIKRLYKLNRYK